MMLPTFCFAQEANVMVQGTTNNLYTVHIATAKENFYSIGRQYNISPKEIAPYNNLTLQNGLSIGQTIRVPLKPSNFVQTNKTAADEVAIPVYHTVGAKETLTQLSTKYNNVSVATLKVWNNIKGESLSVGSNLIVGYIITKKANNSLTISNTKQTAIESKPEQEIVNVKEEPKTIAIPLKKPVVLEIPTKPAVVTEKPIEQPIVTITEAENSIEDNMPIKDLGTGIFKASYKPTNKSQTGVAGVFKSTSGFNDGKFYCLHNDAPQGSIVKITNPANGKIVYAKVLDVIPDLKQNDNLVIRLSNAAASTLGVSMDNFNCTINY